eukprot:6311606-Amphidinium_carterae.1
MVQGISPKPENPQMIASLWKSQEIRKTKSGKVGTPRHFGLLVHGRARCASFLGRSQSKSLKQRAWPSLSLAFPSICCEEPRPAPRRSLSAHSMGHRPKDFPTALRVTVGL